ncbi:MAG: methyltransferase domain-containing protein [Burkholderiales bacterium]|nr:methyltransferase domain-containing protein [Burkholderiales bacterium]
MLPDLCRLDWTALWRELTERVRRPDGDAPSARSRRRAVDSGAQPARADAPAAATSADRPDGLLEFVLARLRPEHTVLDIGAGTGRYAIAFARVARGVTAIEPSAPAAALLHDGARALGLKNLALVDAAWEDVRIDPHDIVFCSHAMYASLDLPGYVSKMDRHARELCMLVMRVPSHDGVMRELSCRIHGQPYDSPNFWVGYHVLYDMGVYASVVMEPGVRRWTDLSMADAIERARRHLRIGPGDHDALIRATLARRLRLEDGRYHWPDGMRSALMWWRPSR